MKKTLGGHSWKLCSEVFGELLSWRGASALKAGPAPDRLPVGNGVLRTGGKQT